MVSSTFTRSWLPTVALCGVTGLALVASGCLDRELKPLNPCLVSGVVEKISVENVDKVDLLFVVDNSGSMREEQQSLRVQFPRLIRSLTRGERLGPGDTVVGTFPAVRDLHLGVVSTDMGLTGVPGRAGLGCGDESRPRGDDGVLRNLPNPGMAQGLACGGSYPPFLQFALTQDAAANDAAATRISNDFSCIASLGTTGCGFEQQLESMLVALWPADNIRPDGMPGLFVDNKPFQDGSAFGQGGPGNPMNPIPPGRGQNTGFLRNNVADGLSLIAVIVVSDEEDCSSHNLGHFVPPNFLNDGDPLKPIGLNLRCYNEAVRVGGDAARDNGQANLYATTRYAQMLKQLRPDREKLVVFAGIVGVPPDLVTPERIAQVDFTDQGARDGFYDSLLRDPRLIEAPDPNTLSANPNLIPSCLRDSVDPGTGMTVTQKAFPPLRFIKVAKEFGANAVIQSICGDDFAPAVNQIIDIIAKQLGAVCLPRELTRDSDGRVSCDVVWELPLPGTAPAGTPTACQQRMGLLDLPAADRPQTSKDGRPLCVVKQVPVVPCTSGLNCFNGFQANEATGVDADGNPLNVDGWFYDDFTPEVDSCPSVEKQRVAFTNNNIDAQPPSGVTVRLECLQQAASVTVPRDDLSPNVTSPPSIGSPCNANEECHVALAVPADCARAFRSGDGFTNCTDTQMFCHATQKVCVAECANKSECLPGFECDGRQATVDPALGGAGRPICVNPTCGE